MGNRLGLAAICLLLVALLAALPMALLARRAVQIRNRKEATATPCNHARLGDRPDKPGSKGCKN